MTVRESSARLRRGARWGGYPDALPSDSCYNSEIEYSSFKSSCAPVDFECDSDMRPVTPSVKLMLIGFVVDVHLKEADECLILRGEVGCSKDSKKKFTLFHGAIKRLEVRSFAP